MYKRIPVNNTPLGYNSYMCGSYTITSKPKELSEYFRATLPSGPILMNNRTRPTQRLPIILEDEPNQIVLGHWGYPIHIGSSEKELINIRAESIETKPFFKKAAVKHRCIILADGFYEWKKEPGKNQPYKLTINHTPMAMAGIYKWQEKKLTGEMLPFFSIITVPPNDFMKDIHDRMPVILEVGAEKNWLLSPSVTDLLRPYTNKMAAEAVSL